MGTFRKFIFTLYSRRQGGRLLVHWEKIGIVDQNILSYSPTVKGKFEIWGFLFGGCFLSHQGRNLHLPSSAQNAYELTNEGSSPKKFMKMKGT
jgi:hypothetical protein